MRPGGVPAVPDGFHLSTRDQHFGPRQGAMLPGGEPEARDRRDAGQCFSPEAEGVDGRQILARADFARGVSFQTEQRVVPVHADPVVGHADQGNSTPPGEDLDAGGTGVDGVFHQLFDHCGGAFDHLARGDLAGHLL